MKKSMAFAAIALVTMTGLFAQTKNSDKTPNPERPLPDEKIVKEYHDSQLNALKILNDAQVKAGIKNQEQADAAIAILKAVQSECKGQCVLQKRTDIPFGMARKPAHRLDCKPNCHRNPKFDDRPKPMEMENGAPVPRKRPKGAPKNPDVNEKN